MRTLNFYLERFASSGVGTFRNWKYKLDKYKAFRVPEKKNGTHAANVLHKNVAKNGLIVPAKFCPTPCKPAMALRSSGDTMAMV